MASLDLNLLPALNALLDLRNVSRAAERLQLSQPAASAALAKLRRYFGDELLVRVGRNYELTPLAHDLLPLVAEALQSIERATTIRSGFDPATSERTFVVAASDYAAAMMMEPLRRILHDEAPGVSVEFLPTSTVRMDRADFSTMDLIVGPTGYAMPGERRHLFRDAFVAITARDHPLLARDPLRIEDLLDYPHAVGHFGDTIVTPPDRLFDELGLTRPVAAHVTGLLSLPLLVEGTDLVALVPRMLAVRSRRGAPIAVIDFPPDREAALVEAMYWHPARTQDPASTWLRSVLQRACSGLHAVVDEAAPADRRVLIPPTAQRGAVRPDGDGGAVPQAPDPNR